MSWRTKICTDPEIHHGVPCFEGTRIPVRVVLDNLEAGVTENELRQAYPTLPADAVRAALDWAADPSRQDSGEPLT